jgi:hypothetical protein
MTSVVAFDIKLSGLRDGEPEWWAQIEVRGSFTLLVKTMRARESTPHSGAGGFPRRAAAADERERWASARDAAAIAWNRCNRLNDHLRRSRRVVTRGRQRSLL